MLVPTCSSTAKKKPATNTTIPAALLSMLRVRSVVFIRMSFEVGINATVSFCRADLASAQVVPMARRLLPAGECGFDQCVRRWFRKL